MGKSYKNYNLSLRELKLDSLDKRREFANNYFRNEKLKDIFPTKKLKQEREKIGCMQKWIAKEKKKYYETSWGWVVPSLGQLAY